MKRPVVRWHALQVAFQRLDFFDQLLAFAVAVDAAADKQFLVGTRHGSFGVMVRAAPRRNGLVSQDAFLSRRGRREPQVEVSFLGRELAQFPDRPSVGGPFHASGAGCADPNRQAIVN